MCLKNILIPYSFDVPDHCPDIVEYTLIPCLTPSSEILEMSCIVISQSEI